MGQALAAEAELGVRLGPRGDLDLDDAVEREDVFRRAEAGVGVAEVEVDVDVGAVAVEVGVGLDLDLDEEVAARRPRALC